MLCGLVDMCCQCREACFLYHQARGRRSKQRFPLKFQYLCTRVCGITSQKAVTVL